MTLTAIETRYAGCLFRSRLEARWAVFFDALRIPWEYEPQGFELPSGRYLPDFRLVPFLPGAPSRADPLLRMWVEIKGRKMSDVEDRKLLEFASAARPTGYVMALVGDIPRPEDPMRVRITMNLSAEFAKTRGWRISATHNDWVIAEGEQSMGFLNSPPLAQRYALEAARSARFEHGQSGAMTSVTPFASPPTLRAPDPSRCERGHRLCCPGKHGCSICANGGWGQK